MTYTLLLRFRAWRYYPEKVPQNWDQALTWWGMEDDDQEDGDCCITGEDSGTQKAHLVERLLHVSLPTPVQRLLIRKITMEPNLGVHCGSQQSGGATKLALSFVAGGRAELKSKIEVG